MEDGPKRHRKTSVCSEADLLCWESYKQSSGITQLKKQSNRIPNVIPPLSKRNHCFKVSPGHLTHCIDTENRQPRTKLTSKERSIFVSRTYHRCIDLHTHTLQSAYNYLLECFRQCYLNKEIYILVITGKSERKKSERSLSGRSLKEEVPIWFHTKAFVPYIRAYSLSLPRLGGEGAFCVILNF